MWKVSQVTWVTQPEGTRICGQVALANITGLPLEAIIKMVEDAKAPHKKHRRGTKTRELVYVLRELGYTVPNRLTSKPTLFGLGKLRWQGKRDYLRGWHWVSIINGTIHYGYELGTLAHANCLLGRVSSYLPVLK